MGKTLYCKSITNHRIGDSTPYPDIAQSLGWTITIDEDLTERAYDGSLWEKGYAPSKPLPTDSEIVAARAALYSSTSDPMFASYEQGGPTTLQSAIDAKAQIQFDNKKSDQAAMTLADFQHKVAAEYDLANNRRVDNDPLSYKYQETNGSDPISIGVESINLVRTTIGVLINLPKISKVQLVKIDNVSEDEVQLVAADGDTLDGANQLVVPAKSIVEIIANVKDLSWDIYTPALEKDPEVFSVGDLLGNEVETKKLIVGMGMKVVKV